MLRHVQCLQHAILRRFEYDFEIAELLNFYGFPLRTLAQNLLLRRSLCAEFGYALRAMRGTSFE